MIRFAGKHTGFARTAEFPARMRSPPSRRGPATPRGSSGRAGSKPLAAIAQELKCAVCGHRQATTGRGGVLIVAQITVVSILDGLRWRMHPQRSMGIPLTKSDRVETAACSEEPNHSIPSSKRDRSNAAVQVARDPEYAKMLGRLPLLPDKLQRCFRRQEGRRR